MMSPLLTYPRWFVAILILWFVGSHGIADLHAAASPAKTYDIPAGDAADTLARFAEQSGEQLVYLVDNVRGQTTNAVRGNLPALSALELMLRGSRLSVHRDGAAGPMTVSRRNDANPSSMPRGDSLNRSSTGTSPELVVLPPFTVSEDAADRYRVADAISAVRVRAPLIDTPSSISVLTRDVIDDLAPTRIFDVARYVAGVQEGRGIQFQDRMILRGFESNGQRTVDNFLQPEDADNIDEVLIDRIEISKGPNAILSPAGAPGGSINVLTKSPTYQSKRSITTTLGLYDAQKMSFDFSGAIASGSQFAYRLIGSLQDSERYWSEDARLRGKVLAPMLTFRPSDRTEVTLKLIAAEHWVFREPLLILDAKVDASTAEPFLAPGLSSRGLNGIQPWSHVGTHSADLTALLTTTVTDNISLRVAANGRYLFEDSIQEFLSTPSFSDRYNPTTGELTQDYTWAFDAATNGYRATYSPFFVPGSIPVRGDKQATRRKTVSVQADVVAKYRVGAMTSQTVSGVALSRRTNYGRGVAGTMPGVDLSQPRLRVEPIWSSSWLFYNDSEFTNWQVYLNERVTTLSDRLQLSGGVLHYDTNTQARNRITSIDAALLQDRKNMWTASVLLKPSENTAVYYSHSTNSSPVIANNLPLWRDGVQDEVGFKSEYFNQRLSFNAAYFQIAQSNVTVPNPDRQTDPQAPETLVSNLGNHGIEFELIGGITPNLSAIATFTDLKMRDNLGRHVRAVADRNAALLLNYRIHSQRVRDRLGLTLGVSYTSRRAGDTPINFTPLNAIGQTSFFLKPSYTTMIGAAYRWNDHLLLRLQVDNVLDDKGYIQQAGGRVSGTGITTAPGVNVKLSATLSF